MGKRRTVIARRLRSSRCGNLDLNNVLAVVGGLRSAVGLRRSPTGGLRSYARQTGQLHFHMAIGWLLIGRYPKKDRLSKGLCV